MFAPIFFVEKLGCTPAAAGAYIAAASSINIPGQFVVGTMESLLINMGFTRGKDTDSKLKKIGDMLKFFNKKSRAIKHTMLKQHSLYK